MTTRTISRANLTTMAGLLCSLIMFIFFYLPRFFGFAQIFFTIGAVFFIVSMILDSLDGYFARRDNTANSRGAAFDDLRDKISMTLFYGALIDHQIISGLLGILLIVREWLVTLLRILYILHNNNGRGISAGWWGKTKTVSQTTLGVIFLGGLINIQPFLKIAGLSADFLPYEQNELWQLIYLILMIFLVIISYASATVYFYKYWDDFYGAITVEKNE